MYLDNLIISIHLSLLTIIELISLTETPSVSTLMILMQQGFNMMIFRQVHTRFVIHLLPYLNFDPMNMSSNQNVVFLNLARSN